MERAPMFVPPPGLAPHGPPPQGPPPQGPPRTAKTPLSKLRSVARLPKVTGMSMPSLKRGGGTGKRQKKVTNTPLMGGITRETTFHLSMRNRDSLLSRRESKRRSRGARR
jgi:hypothetical protein